ncbi:DEAD/DEAH box helicase family protein, partial [Salmonella enterica subsp. enterica]|uniref:DEAD/DEAH box helicase family protein n=1 Tax=Salmonella enterica TaxID=28901 RepID=UPI0022B656FB|nr:DEAD/DEAH box helicase family protein [Salmonella enterica]
LKVVSWQEALARACSELLEGQWAKHYIEQHIDLGDTKLWPSQEQGIAQALWILENVGSVLVADPTGSGKTRMGAHLLRALGDRTWSR